MVSCYSPEQLQLGSRYSLPPSLSLVSPSLSYTLTVVDARGRRADGENKDVQVLFFALFNVLASFRDIHASRQTVLKPPLPLLHCFPSQLLLHKIIHH